MVRVRLLYPFAAVLEQEGVSREQLLETAGVPSAVFDDPNARISYELAGRFLRAAVSGTHHRALGLEASKQHDAAQLHLLEYYVASSPRFETAIADLIRYQDLFTDTRVLSVEAIGDDILLRYASPTPRPRAILEYVLGSVLLAAARSLGGRHTDERSRSSIVSVCVAYPAPRRAREAYLEFFGPNVVFDAPYNGLVVSGEIMRRKPARANPTAHEVLEAQLSAQAGREKRRETFTDRARRFFAGTLDTQDLSQDGIARALRVSRSTLKRRLAAEGTHLRALVAEVRREAALRALNQPDLSIHEVARRAGYEDATAFSKAFKRWMGISPAEHRARQRTRT